MIEHGFRTVRTSLASMVPGMRFNPAAVNHVQGTGAWNRGPIMPRCHAFRSAIRIRIRRCAFVRDGISPSNDPRLSLELHTLAASRMAMSVRTKPAAGNSVAKHRARPAALPMMDSGG
jgi:hypothetical protein